MFRKHIMPLFVIASTLIWFGFCWKSTFKGGRGLNLSSSTGLFITKYYSKPFIMQDLFIRDWDLKDFRNIIEKGGEALRTYLRRKNVFNVLCNEVEMIGEVLVRYTFRHRYAKASHDAGIPLTNIAAAMGHTTEVHHQNYARFIPDGTSDLYVKRNTRGA